MEKTTVRQDKLIEVPFFLNFEKLDQILQVPIRNLTNNRLWYRTFLTNPDNYIMDCEWGILQPKGAVTMRLAVRHNDSLSSFNYIRNKLLVMCIELPAETEPQPDQLKHYYVGREVNKVYLTEIPLIVDCIGFKKLNEVTLHYLRRHVKIQHYSEREIDRNEYDFIKQYCSALGQLESITLSINFLHASFAKPLEPLEPKLMVMKGDRGQILSVFSLSFFSTFTGRQRQIDRQVQHPTLKMICDLEVSPEVEDMISFEDTVVCKTVNRLLIYNVKTQESKGFMHEDFKIALFPPHLCVVLQKKYLHFYDDFENIQVTKIKLKKLLVKCLYKFNNNLYAAGRNCTKVPLLKPTTTRREIYIMKNFDLSNPYVIPDDKIAIPDSPNDIEVMLGQNPYLFVYCRPSIHLVNLRTNQIVTTLNRELTAVQLLEGRYANSLVSAIGISETGKFVRINFEKFASVYGVEVNESNQPVTSLCQAKDGRVFLSNGSMLYEFHAKKLRIITEQKIAEKDERIHQIRTNTKGDIVILKEAAHEWVVEFYKQS